MSVFLCFFLVSLAKMFFWWEFMLFCLLVGPPTPIQTASHIHTCIYKVFLHLGMQWMAIWVHPQANIPLAVGILLAKMGFWLVFLLFCLLIGPPNPRRMHPTSISYVCKCFSTLICCGWAYGSTLRLIYLWRWAFYQLISVFGGYSCCFVCWSALQTPLDCISQSLHMYAKCFSTLECCGWAYGSTLNVLRQCRSGVDFQDFGVELSLSDDVMPWLRLKPPVECIPHPYDMYAKCLSTLTCC